MSLLLDALKRAEQEKLARTDRPGLQVVGASEPAAAPAPSQAPALPQAPAPAAGPAPHPGGKFELEPLAGEAHVASKGAAAPAGAQAAKNVFQAKQAAQEPGRSRRGLLIAVAGIVLVVVAAAGFYVWYAMKSLTPTVRPLATGPVAPPRPPLPAPPPAASPSANPATPAAAAALPGPPPFAPASNPPAAEPTAAEKPAAPVAPVSREELVRELLRQSNAERAAPLKLEPSQARPRVPSEISAGYSALAGGDLGGARRAYAAALDRDGASLDARLGMATVEARAGNAAAAAAHYRRALEVDPGNATALAGLAALADTSRLGDVESRLRGDVLRHPESAPLHFALGNLLSAQRRWSEAQAEYFEAHRLDPGNPDVAHNLAVSLDHLGQPRLAVDFYRRALDAARTRPAQFDPRAVARRLAELGP